jgi:YspA, cpYpsA-related SLOG family
MLRRAAYRGQRGEAGARQAMRVLVCGGRYFQNVVRLWRVLDAFHAKHTIAGVIEGGSDAVGWGILRRRPLGADVGRGTASHQ